MNKPALFLFFAALLGAAPAYAHKPTFGTGAYGSAGSAFRVENIDHSIVVYQELACAARQVWLSFDIPNDGAELYVQLGVPVIERLANYSPTIAVVAPGLPAPSAEVPFTIPAGMGLRVIESGPRPLFHEPFTNTDSWILAEVTMALPVHGKGYVVAWDARGESGKLWVAVGKAEKFGLGDLLRFFGWRSQAQRFHETSGPAPQAPDCR